MNARGQVEIFDTAPGGEPVQRIAIANGGARACLISWGASLQDFRLQGVDHPMVLGSPVLAPYLTEHMRYFGAMAGRVANRIAGGAAEIDGETYRFERNENDVTTLHGGGAGSSTARNWRLDDHGPAHCRFVLQMADGQAGFPGTLDVTVLYRLLENGALRIEVDAVTNRPTLCNFAHHSYWNLDGTADLARHRLTVPAERYLPVDGRYIPTGAPAAVAGTDFDLRAPTPLIRPGAQPIDHNFCLADDAAAENALRLMCRLETPERVLTIRSTEPGLQVYDGARMDTAPHAGLGGRPYGRFAGVALEPQRWPDAPHHPDYPSILLRPGETYRQVSEFHIADRPNH